MVKLRIAELLIPNDQIPLEVRRAIAEGRPEDAGVRLMEIFDLSCDEAAALVEHRMPCGS